MLLDPFAHSCVSRASLCAHELQRGDGGNKAGRDKLLERTFSKTRDASMSKPFALRVRNSRSNNPSYVGGHSCGVFEAAPV
jgi:hypothetical protein